ncbi:MAG: hypothetical protein WEA35_05635 [Candidatus Nanopelagicales bacterium]
MSETRTRPSQVTIVVILIWITFALTLVGAIATILAGTAIAASEEASVEKFLKDLDLPTDWSTTAGPIVIVAGSLMLLIALVEAIFAVAIGRGSNIARILLAILIVIRLIGGLVFILTSFGTGTFMFGIFLDMALGILVLLLLFNSESNKFFTDEVPTR